MHTEIYAFQADVKGMSDARISRDMIDNSFTNPRRLKEIQTFPDSFDGIVSANPRDAYETSSAGLNILNR